MKLGIGRQGLGFIGGWKSMQGDGKPMDAGDVRNRGSIKPDGSG